MPTPFTHLRTAQNLIRDEQLPAPIRAHLSAEVGAFLLGSVAADARVDSGMARANTHFYSYDKPMADHPWRVMLAQHPDLKQAQSPAQRAFIAGYSAHLAMDEFWSLEMLGPHFVDRDWGTPDLRFFMLHIILIYMDERDYADLEPWQPSALYSAAPQSWLPFMSDETLCKWRDFIGQQLPPTGQSLTLQVFGERIGKTRNDFRSILDSPQLMQSNLWNHIRPELLAETEKHMYEFAREQLVRYWYEFE